ncbi:hypothetical protein Nepgr_020318 [Nepenthes gracilis]|uniref:Uncharacterized protein n=1 Tax=Nepenthes gracilis TaxID=150966 RepID=A0AAD3XUW9_NEPGR|nr:hypothetical protein Nepgr_020318 [Nepenthes gracilis]
MMLAEILMPFGIFVLPVGELGWGVQAVAEAKFARLIPGIAEHLGFDSGFHVGSVEKTDAHVDSPGVIPVPVMAEAGADSKGGPIDVDGGSQCSCDVAGATHCSLEDLDGSVRVLGHALSDLNQLDRSPDEDQSAGACSELGVDVSTPDSIMRICNKYSLADLGHIKTNNGCMSASLAGSHLGEAQAEGAEGPGYAQAERQLEVVVKKPDPLSYAIQLLVDGKAFRNSLDSLAMDHRNLVLSFLDQCWFEVGRVQGADVVVGIADFQILLHWFGAGAGCAVYLFDAAGSYSMPMVYFAGIICRWSLWPNSSLLLEIDAAPEAGGCSSSYLHTDIAAGGCISGLNWRL